MQPVGAARAEINIIDLSLLMTTGLKGIHGVLLQTKWGPTDRPMLIGSPEDLRTFYGGPVAGNDGYYLAERALLAGTRLKVQRAAKYQNPDDLNTITGTKASLSVTQTAGAAAAATGTISITGLGTPSSGVVSVVASRPGASDIILANAVSISTTPTATASAIESAIDAGTGTHGFAATASTGDVAITAPTALGADGNRYTIKVTAPNTITFAAYSVPLTGGKDTLVNTGTATIKAKSIGTWANGVTVVPRLAVSNQLGKYDLVVTLPGQSYLPVEVYTDFPKDGDDPTFEAKVTEMLSRSNILSEFTVSDDFTFQPTTYTLANGAETSTMSAQDYVGSAIGGTNLHAFDESPEITKVAVLGVVDPVLSLRLAEYADDRKDVMALVTTPIGLSASSVVDYRYGSGAYSHQPIDSWRTLMFTGGLENVENDNTVKQFSEIGDVMGAISRKDNAYGEHWSFAGDPRGRISRATNVVYNVGTPARRLQADAYDVAGINPVIKNASGNILIWGNSTLWMGDTLLRKAEVAEMTVFLYRSLGRLADPLLFDPNDIETWKSLYRRTQPFLELLKTNRAIWDYVYEGDQDIMDISQAQVNKPEDIDAGKYRVKLFIKPKVAMKYIQFDVALVNSNFDLNAVAEVDL